MNHIVVGTDDTGLIGVYLGLTGVGVIITVNVLANWLAWRQPRRYSTSPRQWSPR